jgi:PAS domain S-box-containing protein
MAHCRPGRLERLHFAACMATMALTSALVFSPPGQPWAQPFLLMPVVAWAAFRFTWCGVAAALPIMLAIAAVGINPYSMRITDHIDAAIILAQALAVTVAFGVGMAHVVSARQRNAARQRDLIETVDLGIFMARDLDGTIRFWSKGAERLYGWTSEEAVGQISHTLLKTIHPVPLAEIEAKVVNEGEWTGDLQHTTKDGRRLTVFARKVRRNRPNGRVVTLLEILHDVTEERRDQAILAEMNRTLEHRIEAAVAEREHAQVRVRYRHHMQALGEIAAGVAHEFNNILQAVCGALEIIASHPGDEDRVERFSKIAADAAGRGSIITSRLLGFAGRAPIRAERIEPALVLDALGDVLAHTLGGKVTVNVLLEPGLPSIVVDKAELETALINLATNARDAMPEGGSLMLSAASEIVPAWDTDAGLAAGHYLRLAVRDEGTGMDATTLARAAEPFYTTKPIGSGTGLGLSMVKGFAEQSGGCIAIESELGKGTTVTMWLPASEACTPSTRPSPAPLAIAAEAGIRVLLVDDELMVRETLAAGLSEFGFSVLIADGGTLALAMLDGGEPIDVLVTDYAMPGMDGLTLIREARERRPTLPALILTGYIQSINSETTDRGLASVFSVLRKPISVAELANSIAAVLTLSRNGHDSPP